MDTFFDERDARLLAQDPYTFSVMKRILRADCTLKLSDHEKMVFCYTCAPYPVWVWTPDDLSDEEMEEVYRTALEQGLLDGKHHFNLKYDLANYFIRRAAQDGKRLAVGVNMFAYDCPCPVPPTASADGKMRPCRTEDLETLVDFLEHFHREVGVDERDRESYYQTAREHIDQGTTYFWINAAGEPVASCRYGADGQTASVGLVYTRPEHRRRHYAENLVYQVTKTAKDTGYLPMLYTDADYAASNACYEKLGYVLRGKLCTVEMK